MNWVFLKCLLYSDHQCGSWLFGPLLGRKCRDWTSKLQVNTDALCTQQHIQIAVICQTAREGEVLHILQLFYSCPPVFLYLPPTSISITRLRLPVSNCVRERRKRASGSQGLVCICLWSIKLIGLLGHVVYNGLISPSSIKYSLLFSPLSRGNMTLTALDSTSELTSATLACYWHFTPCFFLSKPVSFSLVSAHAPKHVISSCPNWWPWQPAPPLKTNNHQICSWSMQKEKTAACVWWALSDPLSSRYGPTRSLLPFIYSHILLIL